MNIVSWANITGERVTDRMSDSYLRFISACIRGDAGEPRALVLSEDWNWESLLRTASDVALLPALHGLLSRLDVPLEIPEEVAEFLLSVDVANRERNAAIVSELTHAAKLLNKIGIHPVLLKGLAYLADRVYPDPAARYIGDIDLLLPEAQVASAVEVLKREGFRQHHQDPFGPFRHHHPPVSRVGQAPIELHHSLGLGKCARLLPARDVVDKSVAHDLGGVRVRIPCPEHLACHLIMHSQLHHSYTERIWPPFRCMFDLVSLDRRYGAGLNWSAVQTRFRDAGEHGSLLLHLRQVGESMGIAPPLAGESTVLTRVRWSRRMFLRKHPDLRYVDPIYMYRVLVGKRMPMLCRLLGSRDGREFLSARMTEREMYVRFWTDLVEGRGH